MILVNRHDHDLGTRITLLLLHLYYEGSHYGEVRPVLQRAYELGFGDHTFEYMINTTRGDPDENPVLFPGFPTYLDVIDNRNEGRHALELYQNVQLEV